MKYETVAAAFDSQGRTLVAFTGKEGWSDVYMIDPKGKDMTRMWVGQVDALTALQRFEEECHPHMRPFNYIEK